MKPNLTTLLALGLLSSGTFTATAQETAAKAAGGGRLGEFLQRADSDADGKISQSEFNEFAKKDTSDRFLKMDVNADGFVDKTEIGQVAERLREGMKSRSNGESPDGGPRRPSPDREGGFRRPPGGEGDKPMPRPEGGRPDADRPSGGPPGGPGMLDLDQIYGRMDKNSDGQVDKEEYLEFSKQEIESRFGRMDENQDGKVSKDEMKAGMERMRNMMRGPGAPDGQGMRRPGSEGGEGGFRRPPEREGGGFRRPPSEEGAAPRPRPELEEVTPKKDPA